MSTWLARIMSDSYWLKPNSRPTRSGMASHQEKNRRGQKKLEGSWGILHGYSWRCVCCQAFRLIYHRPSRGPSYNPLIPCRRVPPRHKYRSSSWFFMMIYAGFIQLLAIVGWPTLFEFLRPLNSFPNSLWDPHRSSRGQGRRADNQHRVTEQQTRGKRKFLVRVTKKYIFWNYCILGNSFSKLDLVGEIHRVPIYRRSMMMMIWFRFRLNREPQVILM